MTLLSEPSDAIGSVNPGDNAERLTLDDLIRCYEGGIPAVQIAATIYAGSIIHGRVTFVSEAECIDVVGLDGSRVRQAPPN